jgi:uncharacterized protein YgiB involved in biofilm formation
VKRSRYVRLVVVGSVLAVAGCDTAETMELKQQVYRSRDDCLKDWGDGRNCTESSTAAHANGYVGGGYLGPRYYWDRELSRPVAVSADGTTRTIMGARIGDAGSSVGETVHVGSISRGGFGAHAGGSARGG